MDANQTQTKVTAIVPAYNEAPRIGAVLDVLTSYPGFTEVIVIDDCSSDNTPEIAKSYDIRYIRNSRNLGKGKSMDIAVSAAHGDIIFFADADVKGLNHTVIEQTVGPVVRGEVSMFIAMRNRKIYFLRFLLPFTPLLGGERAIVKTLWDTIPDWYKRGFRIEAGMNFYTKYYDGGFSYKVFPGLSQEIKEKKYGLLRGLRGRLRMVYEVFSSQLRLELTAIPESAKNGRDALLIVLANLAGLAVGVLIMLSSWFGPARFIDTIFANELYEDPRAPFVHYLISLVSHVSLGTLSVIGIIVIVLNAVFLTASWKNAYLYIRNIVFSKRL